MAPEQSSQTTKKRRCSRLCGENMRQAFFLIAILCFAIGWLSFEAQPLAALGFFLASIMSGGLSQIAKEILK
jgi:hypothetical protein